jgi:hypothetical protein
LLDRILDADHFTEIVWQVKAMRLTGDNFVIIEHGP